MTKSLQSQPYNHFKRSEKFLGKIDRFIFGFFLCSSHHHFSNISTSVIVMLSLLVAYLVIFCALALSCAEFSLGIRDSIMIAHSFKGGEFGPAQNLHGATYTVDVDFFSEDLVESSNWVIDIGLASDMLAAVLKKYNFQHLNTLFPDENTTTEFMCRAIHGDMCRELRKINYSGKLGVKLHESHKAWAKYVAPVI